jgi:adenylate kinase
VPDQLILDLVTPRLAAAAAKQGYVLDGFPRSVQQAETLDYLISQAGSAIDVVVNLEVPESTLLQRLQDRAAEQDRSDDTREVIENRLRVFDETTQPLVNYYALQGKLLSVDADREMGVVTDTILAGVASLLA